MEIASISPTSIRIKGKQATFVIDPVQGKSKLQADAVILLQSSTLGDEVEGSRLTMSGPGEYEVSGVKITGVKSAESVAYYLSMDAMTVLLSHASALKGKESVKDVDIAVILADGVADQSALATVTSGVSLFYGAMASENVKALGKDVQPVAKYMITKEKLPTEMEIILLA